MLPLMLFNILIFLHFVRKTSKHTESCVVISLASNLQIFYFVWTFANLSSSVSWHSSLKNLLLWSETGVRQTISASNFSSVDLSMYLFLTTTSPFFIDETIKSHWFGGKKKTQINSSALKLFFYEFMINDKVAIENKSLKTGSNGARNRN